MMKRLPFIIILFLSFNVSGQSKYVGYYHDFFGNSITINADSTFKYTTHHFDLSGSWTKGKWKSNNDTLYFTMIPIYDTLDYFDSIAKANIVKLVLSGDEKSNLISNDEAVLNTIANGGQNFYPYPSKLFYRNNKFFGIDNKGKLLKKRVKGFWTKKKYVPWFVKQKDKH